MPFFDSGASLLPTLGPLQPTFLEIFLNRTPPALRSSNVSLLLPRPTTRRSLLRDLAYAASHEPIARASKPIIQEIRQVTISPYSC